jgi:hypothetical protein
MAASCPFCGWPLPWRRRLISPLTWLRWNCRGCSVALCWENARLFLGLEIAVLLVAGVVAAMGFWPHGAAMVALAYLGFVFQAQPEFVHRAGGCLKCGYEGGGSRCSECGWERSGAR